MKDAVVITKDGISLRYAVSDYQEDKPWIALIIPFGLRPAIAKPFFDFFQPQYNIVSWESRLILDDEEQATPENAFELHRHVADFEAVLSACSVRQCIVVGYCSGAGIALGAANRYPHLISSLVLVHGEYAILDQPELCTQFAMEIDSLLGMASKSESQLQQIYKKIMEERLDPGDSRPDGIDLPYSELYFLRRYARNYQSYKKADFKKLASVVTHSTLLMTGKRDVQANAESTEAIASVMPNSMLHIDDDADHYGILREESRSLITIWNFLCEERRRCA